MGDDDIVSADAKVRIVEEVSAEPNFREDRVWNVYLSNGSISRVEVVHIIDTSEGHEYEYSAPVVDHDDIPPYILENVEEQMTPRGTFTS